MRRVWFALGALALVGGAAVAAFPVLCRHAVDRAAEAYGATVTVGVISPAVVGIRLRDVDVAVAELPSFRIHFDEVGVAYSAGTRRVDVRGGVARATGEIADLSREVREWRSHHVRHPAKASGGQTELAVSGLRLAWARSETTPGEAVVADGVSIARTTSGLTVTAAEARLSSGGSWISAQEGRLQLVAGDGDYRVNGLTATAVTAEIELPREKERPNDAIPPPSTPSLPEPRSPEPAPVRPRKGARAARAERSLGRRDSKDGRDAASQAAALRPPTPAAPVAGPATVYRATVLGLVNEVDRVLEPDARIRVDGLRARLRRGSDVLNLGPGSLRVGRADGQMVVELAPSAATTPMSADEVLTFRVALPLGRAEGDIAADIAGGPIWLSTLGIHEGDFGLFDVSRSSLTTRSHLVLPSDGRSLRVDGSANVRSLSVRSAALSDEPVSGVEVAVRLRGEFALDGSRAQIAEAEADFGAVRLSVRGDYERGADDGRRFRGSFEVPLTACQSMFDAVPKGLMPKLQGMRFAGSYALKGRVDGDTSDLDHRFTLDWDVSNTCRVIEAPPSISVDQFKAPFKRTAYDGQGRAVTVETGPGTVNWVPGSAISKFMEAAVLTTEDGGFRRHHGFDHQAIRNSIRENVRQRHFVRGASTISMQLAKNLYLDRGKNLSRKLQEALLTMYLEQELTKEQILELYFNIVEFGPMLYGVGPAARAYFNTSARDLALSQALYLSSIMPNPKVQHFGAGGAVAAGWMNYLHKLMKLSRDRNLITDEELEEGLRETAVRGAPLPSKSAGRPASSDDPSDAPPEDTNIWVP